MEKTTIIKEDIWENEEWELRYIDKNWNGKYFSFAADTPYIRYEFADKTLCYTDGNGIPLKKLKNFTSYEQYIGCSTNLQRETYLKSEVPVITEKIREEGSITRYFVKDKLTNNIFEILKTGYNKTGVFYERTSFKWKLTGIKSNVRSYNRKSLINASFIIPELYIMINPLQFYVEELTSEQIKLKRIEELIEQDGYTYVHGHNPHSHPTEDMFIDEESNQPMVTVPMSRRSTTTGRAGY